jgi:hypothetical protein
MKKLILAAALALSATSAQAEELARLQGVVYDEKSITFQVGGNPCINRDGIAFEMLESDPVQLRVIEKDPQAVCHTLIFWPWGVQLTYTYEELGLAGGRFVISNPIEPGVIHTRVGRP